MGVTLKDVAKKAGVSIGTASMALNNSKKVNIDTYKKVHKIARELKYIPNARARALVKQSTNIIGLVVPHIINPFFAELAQAVKDTVKNKGYNVILCSTDGKEEEEARYIDFFKGGMIDGAIFTSQETLSRDNSQLLGELAADYIPVVNINSQDFGSNLIPVIKTDLKKAGYQATKYMIELGHQKIGFASHSPRRFEGYKEAMKEYSLYNQEYVYYPMNSVDEVIENILQSRNKPTAFVCYNDKSAIKMIQLLVGQGLRVPEDISVCGTDNIRMSKYYNPPLTTINIPKKEMGSKAAELLLSLIAGERLAESEMEINFLAELVVRKSTASVK